MDKTLISIEVAHYMKIWANFLKNKNPKVRVFYLACIGQLILSPSIQKAEELLTSLFTCSLSELMDSLKLMVAKNQMPS